MLGFDYYAPCSIQFMVTDGCGDMVLKEWLEAKPILTQKYDELASRLTAVYEKPIRLMNDLDPFQEEIQTAKNAIRPFTVRINNSITAYEKMQELPRVPKDVDMLKAIKNDAFNLKERYRFLRAHN